MKNKKFMVKRASACALALFALLSVFIIPASASSADLSGIYVGDLPTVNQKLSVVADTAQNYSVKYMSAGSVNKADISNPLMVRITVQEFSEAYDASSFVTFNHLETASGQFFSRWVYKPSTNETTFYISSYEPNSGTTKHYAQTTLKGKVVPSEIYSLYYVSGGKLYCTTQVNVNGTLLSGTVAASDANSTTASAILYNAKISARIEYNRKVEYYKDLAETSNGDPLQLFTGIISAPFDIFSNVLNFEILGVNIWGLCSALITIGLVIFALKKLGVI